MGWNDAKALMQSVVAGYFDTTPCTAVAMRKPAPNADYEADASRLSFDFLGTIDLAPEMTSALDSRRPQPSDRNIRLVSKICLTALTTEWPWVLKQGDRIQSGSVIYQVAAAPENDGSDRVAVWLNRIAK